MKPNSGVVDPNAEVSIAVNLKPFEFDPNEENMDKFMVQSMFAPETGEINQDAMVSGDGDYCVISTDVCISSGRRQIRTI